MNDKQAENPKVVFKTKRTKPNRVISAQLEKGEGNVKHSRSVENEIVGRWTNSSIQNTKQTNITGYIQGQAIGDKSLTKIQNASTQLTSNNSIEPALNKAKSSFKVDSNPKEKNSDQDLNKIRIQASSVDRKLVLQKSYKFRANRTKEAKTDKANKLNNKYDDDVQQFISNLSSEISSARFKTQSRRNIRSQINSRTEFPNNNEQCKSKMWIISCRCILSTFER